MPVAAIGSVTVLIVALATSDLVNRRAGLMAGGLLALSTGHIYFSQEARMYPQLAFGLALAIWGLVGFVDRNGRWLYLILYLIGGVIAIYSQIVALFCLLILNALALACALLNGEKDRVILWGLAVNLVLLVVSLPWLLSIPEAIESFGGLGLWGTRLTLKFFRNLVGFPGVPSPLKIAADAFMLLVYAIGAVFAWRRGRRTFGAVTIGILATYPLMLNTLSLVLPILASRVFIPCVIPASMLFGVAAASLRRPVAQAVLLTGVLSLAAWSEVEAYRLGVKPEDVPQALALVDAQGFAGAPILSCSMLVGWHSASLMPLTGRSFFSGQGTKLIRYNDRWVAAFSLPLIERLERRRNGALMRSFLLKNDLSYRSCNRLDFGRAARPDHHYLLAQDTPC